MSKIKRVALATGFILPFTSTLLLADHPTVAFGSNQAGPFTTIPASTLPAGTWSSGFRIERVSFSPLSASVLEQAALDSEDIHSVDSLATGYLSLAYGISEQLSIGVNIPRVARDGVREGELELGVPEVHKHSEISGLGDATLLGEFQLKSSRLAAIQYSVLFGVQLPTGDDEVEQEGKHIEAEFKPGSGTWHPLIGIAASRRIGAGSLDANLLYLHTRENSEHARNGALLNYNIAWSYRYSSEPAQDHDHEEHYDLTWDTIIELNGELRGKSEAHGHKEAHSGGNLVYLSPGARLTIADTWNLNISIGIPLLNDANGTQADVDYRASIGVGVIFR